MIYPGEIMAVCGARLLQDNDVVVVGVGLPQVSAYLAKMTHAPHLNILLEIGVVNPIPKEGGVGIADPRLWYRSVMMRGFVDVMGMMLHRGLVDTGFLGALETDMHGNINTTIVEVGGRKRHFTGSGGANDIASLAKRVVIIMRHEKRKLPVKVQYVTSPGFLGGGQERENEGLRGGGPFMIITDKAVFSFNEKSKKALLLSVHEGISVDEVLNDTAFPVEVSGEVAITARPSGEELKIIREVLDPQGTYTR